MLGLSEGSTGKVAARFQGNKRALPTFVLSSSVPHLTSAYLSSDIQPAIARIGDELGRDRIRRNVPLAPYTTFRIGGPTDWFVETTSADELEHTIRVAREEGTPHFLLGCGANILVGDRGFRGLVIHNAATGIDVDESNWTVHAESGAIFYPDVIHAAVSAGLQGIEHYVGIPGTVGGALWQNLHFLSPPPERERTMYIAEVLKQASILTEEGDRKDVGVDYFNFGYDYSILHDREDVVLSATFQLSPGDPEVMRRTMDANLQWRSQRHPPLDTEPSAGSIFKKIEGIGAGRLIDQAGLTGTRVGGAEITRRHANIMINRGGARAADVQALIQIAQRAVRERFGLELEPEIAFVGEFDPPTVVP